MVDAVFMLQSVEHVATIVSDLSGVSVRDCGLFNVIQGDHLEMGNVAIINDCGGNSIGIRT